MRKGATIAIPKPVRTMGVAIGGKQVIAYVTSRSRRRPPLLSATIFLQAQLRTQEVPDHEGR